MVKKEIKPNKRAFFFSNFFKVGTSAAIALPFFFLLYYFLREVMWIPSIGVVPLIAIALLFLLWLYILTAIAYKKEVYILDDYKLIHKSGFIFSNHETELNVLRITRVGSKLPFFENKFFGTGEVEIEAAGSGKTEVFLKSIKNPEEVYDYIKELMKKQGFSLKMDESVMSARPSTFAAFFETIKTVVGIILMSSFLIAYTIGKIISEEILSPQDIKNFIINLSPTAVNIFWGALALIGFYGLVWSTIFIFNLSKREYELYKDTINYRSGYFTKESAFIPIENLADTLLSQSIIDRIFGLYNVGISCQGSAKGVGFGNVKNGPEFEAALDKLIQKTDLRQISQEIISGRKVDSAKRGLGETIAEYKQDMKRAIFFGLTPALSLLFSMFLVYIPITISIGFNGKDFLFFLLITGVIFLTSSIGVPIVFIRAKYTSYQLTRKGIKENFKFIGTKNREFNVDKITGVVFKESIIDKLFGTISVEIWSIGSPLHIEFKYLKKTQELFDNLLEVTGMKSEKVLYSVKPDYTFGKMLKAEFIASIIVGILLAFSIYLMRFGFWFILGPIITAVGLLIGYIYSKQYFKDASIEFYDTFIKCSKGWLMKKQFYSEYADIKDIKSVRYPFGDFGKIMFNVSGGGDVRQASQKTKSAYTGAIALLYVPEIEKLHTLSDLILHDKKYLKSANVILKNIDKYDTKVIMESKQMLGNTILPTFLFTLPISPIILPWVYAYIKSKSYNMDSYRASSEFGWINRKKITVLYSKIDHLSTKRGFLNKMFNNGTILVNTIGSNFPELTIKNIKDYEDFYKKLEKCY